MTEHTFHTEEGIAHIRKVFSLRVLKLPLPALNFTEGSDHLQLLLQLTLSCILYPSQMIILSLLAFAYGEIKVNSLS